MAVKRAPSKKVRAEQARRPKKNPLIAAGIETVDYKDVNLLRTFISDRGKIRSRRVTGLTPQQQRQVAVAVKNARRWRCSRSPAAEPRRRVHQLAAPRRRTAPIPRRPSPLMRHRGPCRVRGERAADVATGCVKVCPCRCAVAVPPCSPSSSPD